MSSIKFEVKLFDVTTFAADGSNIPRETCMQYIDSPDYQEVIEKRIGLGGVTHKDRKLDEKYKGRVGVDDQLLISNNATHYYTKLYFKPGDNFLYAAAETLDPDLYDGERKVNITNLIADIKSNISMPVSAVIRALWNRRGMAKRIVRFKGFDFTLNPSFKGAGDLIVLDNQIETNTYSETRSFSDVGPSDDSLMEMERIFSFNAEFTPIEIESTSTLTRDELIDKYGLFSEIIETESSKEFSIQTSLTERMINQEQPRFTKFDRVIKGHANYWKSKKLSDDKKRELKVLLITDLRTMILEVTPEIKDGRTLSSLYALSRYSTEIDLIGKKLSNTTRRLKMAQDVMGFYPKRLYEDWKSDMIKFFNLFSDYCFGEGLGAIAEDIGTEFKLV